MKPKLTTENIVILGLLAITGVLLIGYIAYYYIVPFITTNITYILGLAVIVGGLYLAVKKPELFKKYAPKLLIVATGVAIIYFAYKGITYLASLPQQTAIDLLTLVSLGTFALITLAICITILIIITVAVLALINRFYLNQLQKEQSINETYRASKLAFILSVINAITTGLLKNIRWTIATLFMLSFILTTAWITDQIGEVLKLDEVETWWSQQNKEKYALDDVIPPLLLDGIGQNELSFLANLPKINTQQAKDITYFYYKYISRENYTTLLNDIRRDYTNPTDNLKPPYNTINIFFGATNTIYRTDIGSTLTDRRVDNQLKIDTLKRSRNRIFLTTYLLAKGFTPNQTIKILTDSYDNLYGTSSANISLEESAMRSYLENINKRASDPLMQEQLEKLRQNTAPFIYQALGNGAITLAIAHRTILLFLNIITVGILLSITIMFAYQVILPLAIAYGLPNPKQIYQTLTDTRNPSTAEAGVIKSALDALEIKDKAPRYDGIRVIPLSSQNAYATGKTIVLHKGLLTMNPNEIAAVIAHEIAHIHLKHTRISALIPPIPVIKRRFEYEADAWVTTQTNQGLELANFLRFHEFFDLEAPNTEQPYKDTPIIGGRTHPENEMRRDRILRMLGLENQDQSSVYPEIEPQLVSDMAVANPRVAPKPAKAGI